MGSGYRSLFLIDLFGKTCRILRMGYQQALDAAWHEIASLTDAKQFSVRLFADEYSIDAAGKSVTRMSCAVPAKDYTAIILLHYLIRACRLGNLPQPIGEWIDFKELEGGDAYYPTFRKRTIDRIVTKFGSAAEKFEAASGRFPVRKATIGDQGYIFQAFAEVPILIALYAADDEFGADANILFDKGIAHIFCTEDIVVLTEILVHSL